MNDNADKEDEMIDMKGIAFFGFTGAGAAFGMFVAALLWPLCWVVGWDWFTVGGGVTLFFSGVGAICGIFAEQS